MKRQNSNSFAHKVHRELRNEFGPAAVSGATRLALIAVGLALVFAIGSDVIEITGTLGDVIEATE